MPLTRSRGEWGSTFDYARRHRDKPAPRAKRGAYLHHSVTIAPDLIAVTIRDREDEHAAMRTLERIGTERFSSGVSYNVAVMPSGEAYDGQPLDNKATHSGFSDDNLKVASIVLVGNYEKATPTLKQRLKVARILVSWRKARVLATLNDCLRPHSDTKQTACPGQNARALIGSIVRQAKLLSVVAPKPPAPAYRNGRKVYRSKMHRGQLDSDSVWNVRLALSQRHYAVKPGDDYGQATVDAVRAFQRAQGWRGGDADGIVGPGTARALSLVWVTD